MQEVFPLEALAADLDTTAPPPFVDTIRHLEVDSVISVRNLAKREIDVRLVPWERVIATTNGLEMFSRGAFDGTDPTQVRLMGLEHEAHIGLGQNGQPTMIRIPVGKGMSLDDRDDGAYMTFRVAQTARGDEVLALASEGIASGVSTEFAEVPGGSPIETRSGRRLKNHKRVRLTGASTTYQPAYGSDPQGAVVLAVRTKGDTDVSDTAPVPEASAPPIDYEALGTAFAKANSASITALGDRLDKAIENAMQTRSAIPDEAMGPLMERLDSLEEQSRASFQIPATTEATHPADFGRGDWLKLVLRTLSGDTVSQAELQARTVADLVTADNLGVVPPTYSREIIGIIDKGRPFLESTRKMETPDTMALIVPTIVTRPTTGVQSAQKDELASTTTSITTTQYNPITVGGYGDISLQLLKKSSPSYLTMYLDLLSEAYAIDADDQAVDALIAAGMSLGGAFDPDDGPAFGEAWANAVAVSRMLKPDTIWMSTEAVRQFIDAVNPTTGAPLYGKLVADFSAASGVGGEVSGLRPVHVPAMDDEQADIIVGPSRAFGWAEDGTYTLQVDVPAKAGRDVGIVGMLWFAPLYPTAFTRYWLES